MTVKPYQSALCPRQQAELVPSTNAISGRAIMPGTLLADAGFLRRVFTVCAIPSNINAIAPSNKGAMNSEALLVIRPEL